MSIWKVNVRGQEHTVRFASPVFGAKTIFVDDVPIKEVGMTISMWGNYDFDVDGEPAQIKFRAIKSMKGMSLYMNGQKIEPEPGAGRVLVVDGGGSMRCALLGDRLGALAVANGWAGLVIHGCVRDVAELERLDLGVRARIAWELWKGRKEV